MKFKNTETSLNHYLMQWKGYDHFELITGNGFIDAFTNNFHISSHAAVKNYEQVYPTFFNGKVGENFTSFTVYYSKSGYGIKIRWVKGQLNSEFRSLLARSSHKKYYKSEDDLRKFVWNVFNSEFNRGE